MKILHVINHFSVTSGAARLLASLIPCQIEQGHQVDVVALIEYPPLYVAEVEKYGCHYTLLGKGDKGKYSFSNVWKLMPYLRKYDVVHVHLFPSLYWVVIAKMLSNATCKLVVTEHSTLNNRQGKWYLKPLERFVYRHYDRIIAISNSVKEYLHMFVSPTLAIDVIANGISLDSFQHAKPISRKDLGIAENAILLIQVAGFRPQKDQLTLLKALRRLPEKYHVMFVGIGDTLQRHQDRVKEWGLEKRVCFMGLRQDIPTLLKTSDIVVMSSHFEGFGLAAVEGMAAGKPVIASDVPGLKEVVQGAGILFPVHDDEVLANEIMHLSQDKIYADKITEQCLKRARKYDIRIMAAKYEAVYKRILIN